MAKTVLIVEDNHSKMVLFAICWRRIGYQDLRNQQWLRGRSISASQPAPDLRADGYPVVAGLGLEVTNGIKDDPELRKIPVVAATAFAMKGDEERTREGGCEAHSSKPIPGLQVHRDCSAVSVG